VTHSNDKLSLMQLACSVPGHDATPETSKTAIDKDQLGHPLPDYADAGSFET